MRKTAIARRLNNSDLSPQHSSLSPKLSPLVTHPSSLSPHHFGEVLSDLLTRGYKVRFRAPGMSMYPTILDGEVITVEPIAPSDVRRRDIILYRAGKKLIAHRLIRIQRKPGARDQSSRPFGRSSSGALLKAEATEPHPLFFLRGDASGTCDDAVEPHQILGKVVSVERAGTQILLHTARAKLSHILRYYLTRLKRRLGSALDI